MENRGETAEGQSSRRWLSSQRPPKMLMRGHWCKQPTHWKRPWCWERLRAGGEGDDRGWGGWMASPTQWTWVWSNSGRQWRIGRPGVLQSMGLQRVRQDLMTKQQLKFQCGLTSYKSQKNHRFLLMWCKVGVRFMDGGVEAYTTKKCKHPMNLLKYSR